ncbi:type II toxin-antitoxin system MqsA family antitoxin [Acidobacteria bacterium AH-259-G07]|nr:type II toxin-antitoxin system MqsA family antitoxin [Acidobacteria bacterium AH-259-L09]MDA2926377.1 type II toxin-antitoxin system MqsA family antitoxin [Acidobacteria bacterium AH-259-G07]
MSEVSKCALCGGNLRAGKTTYSVDYGQGVLVVRNVPAEVCEQCGESWISDAMSARLEELTSEAKERKLQIEVIDLAA